MTSIVHKLLKQTTVLALVVLVGMLGGCGGGGGGSVDSGSSSSSGTLRLALTDAPACAYDAVHVTVQKVRVHKSASAGETDAGWSEVVLQPAQRVDLLKLTNGVLFELGQTLLPAGRYTQMRLVLAPNDNASPLANAVTPSGGTQTALSTPSAVQSGLKLDVNIEVLPGQVADFVLDFDACRSVVKAGNSGRYNLKPVIAVIPRVDTALIGYVNTALVAGAVSVSAQQGGVPVRTTTPDATGKFVLAPLPAGTYDVVVVAVGRATATVTDVPVSATAGAIINSVATPITPPVSLMRTVAGGLSVTPTPSEHDSLVIVRRAYTGGPTVEVTGGPVDAVSGGFSFSLPAVVAVKASYGPALTFAPDAPGTAGVYTLYATSGGITKSAEVNLGSGDKTGVMFGFP